MATTAREFSPRVKGAQRGTLPQTTQDATHATPRVRFVATSRRLEVGERHATLARVVGLGGARGRERDGAGGRGGVVHPAAGKEIRRRVRLETDAKSTDGVRLERGTGGEGVDHLAGGRETIATDHLATAAAEGTRSRFVRFSRGGRVSRISRGVLVQAARAGGNGILQEVHGEARVRGCRGDARRRGRGRGAPVGGVHRLVAREHAGRVSTASERRGGSLAGRPRGDEDGLDPRPDQLVLGHDAAARQNRGIDRQLALQRKRRLRRGGEEETIVVRHPTTTRHEPGVGRGDRARRASRAVEGGHAPRERRPSSPESRAGGSRSRRARYLARVSAEGDRPPAGAPEMACRQAGGSTQSIPSAAREQPMTCSYAEYTTTRVGLGRA